MLEFCGQKLWMGLEVTIGHLKCLSIKFPTNTNLRLSATMSCTHKTPTTSRQYHRIIKATYHNHVRAKQQSIQEAQPSIKSIQFNIHKLNLLCNPQQE